MKAIVDALDRPAIHRDPTGIECDDCGVIFRKKPYPDADTYRNSHLREEAIKQGWQVIDDKDYCPKCLNKVITESVPVSRETWGKLLDNQKS